MSRPSRAAFVLAAVLFLFGSVSLAMPTWSEFRRLGDAQRASIEKEVLTIVSKIDPSGFKTKRARFCVGNFEGKIEIWETSPTASCKTTQLSSVRFGWDPILTIEGLNFSWIAYARLAAAYCEANAEDTSCLVLELPGAKPGARYFWFEFLVPSVARASDASVVAAPAPAIAISAPAASASSVAVACEPQGDVITMKNGKKIFVDAGPQPNEDLVSRLEKIAQESATGSVPAKMAYDNLESLRKQGKAITANFKKKRAWVRDRIFEDGVSWIGTEHSVNELGDETGERFARSFTNLRRQLMQTDGVANEQVLDALSAATCQSASVCLWLQDSSARKARDKAVPLVPLETHDFKQRQMVLRQTEAATMKSVNELVADGKSGFTKENLAYFMRVYGNMWLSNAALDKKNLETTKAQFGHPGAKAAIEALFNAVAEYKKLAKERDAALVTKAVALEGNGIISIGSTRRDAVMTLLQEACVGPKAAPGPASAASGVKKKPAAKSPKAANAPASAPTAP